MKIYAAVVLIGLAIFLMSKCVTCIGGVPGSRCDYYGTRGVVNGHGVCEPV